VSEKDTLFAGKSGDTGDFAGDFARDFVFDERVVRVFADMIRRSVPGYGLVLHMLGPLARRYVRANTSVYDLGCSLGAATLAMRRAVSVPGVRFIAVDNSPQMIAQCRERLSPEDGQAPVECLQQDICRLEVSNASMTVLNYTLQFIEPKQRLVLLGDIAAGTLPGGALVLSEKIRFEDPAEQALQTELHHDFKRAQGYSELEIARKRNALERVLQPDTDATHRRRLLESGWRNPVRCFQAFNFVTYLAFR
jgi:tRNA (cmo5U34)-methyltransferase